MLRTLVLGLCALLFVLPASGKVTLLENAHIITLDAGRPFAEALVFDEGGEIRAVGNRADLIAAWPQATRLDAGGATVVPGLIDAHGHVLNLGLSLLRVDLSGTQSTSEIIERLQAFAASLPDDAWLLGRGWDQNDWPEGEQVFPSAADLDTAFPSRPVWLTRIDGHAHWANSAALRFAQKPLDGIWQPEGGEIIRIDGKPSGVFVDAAAELIEQAVPPLDDDIIDLALNKAFAQLSAQGITAVHDAGVSLSTLRRMQALADQSPLPVRVYAMANGDGDALDMLCSSGAYRHQSGRLQMRAVKLYADGALGSRGALMLADYSDAPGQRGLAVTSREALELAMRKAKRCDVQVATHAIGDHGNRRVLDLYQQVLGDAADSDHRWRIEHAQVVATEDIPRLAALRVIASVQPTHATSDMPWAEQRVGPERILGAYAWRSLRDAGVMLALGSDFPVEHSDPLLGLYAAVARQDLQGKPGAGWYANQRLTAFEALRGFTLDAAYAGFAESALGSLKPGKRADFILLSANPLAVAPGQLPRLRVLATYVDGASVYRAPVSAVPRSD